MLMTVIGSRGTMLIAFICVVALPIPSILYYYGPRLRQGLLEQEAP